MKFIFLQASIIFLCFLTGCDTGGQEAVKQFNDLKSEVKANYDRNQKVFEELRSYVRSKYIRVIEFNANNEVFIDLRVDYNREFSPIKININDSLPTQLKQKGLSTNILYDLKKKLQAINANSIVIQDDYDITKGLSFKILDIKYLKVANDFFFTYRIYERPLDSIESGHYETIVDNDGGVLGKDVIYFHQQ